MLSVVVPTYNRSHMLEEVYRRVDSVMKAASIEYELIFVDDVGDVATPKVIKALAEQHTSVKGVLLSKNVGQQNATLAGIRTAKYQRVVTMDDDLSSDPKWIVNMLEELEKGYSVCYGVPKVANHIKYRSVMTLLKERVFTCFLGKPKNTRLTSFRMMDGHVKSYIVKDQSPKVYLSARTLQYTQNIQNIEVDMCNHHMGSGYTIWSLLVLMFNIIKFYSKLGYFLNSFHKINKKHATQYEIKEIYS